LANPGATVAALSDVLKFRYLGPIRSQLNDEVLITQILNLDSKNIDLDGLSAYVPLKYGRNSGVGARREYDTLPTAGNQAYKHVNFDLTYQYGRAQFSGQAIQKTKTDAGAFVRVITSELDGLRKDQAGDVYRACQAQEQAWREKRRVRELEELRAKSGGINLAGGAAPAAAGDDGSQALAGRLQRAKDMLQQGLLTDAEFEQVKARILSEL